VHPIGKFELGLTQEIGVGLGGELLSQPSQIVLDGGPEDLEETLGRGGLFKREEGGVKRVPL
jgi:hypothetical protein